MIIVVCIALVSVLLSACGNKKDFVQDDVKENNTAHENAQVTEEDEKINTSIDITANSLITRVNVDVAVEGVYFEEDSSTSSSYVMHGQDEEGDYTIPIWIDVYEDNEGEVDSIYVGCPLHYFDDGEDKEDAQLLYDFMLLTFSSVRHAIGATSTLDTKSSMEYFLFFNGDEEYLTAENVYEKYNDGDYYYSVLVSGEDEDNLYVALSIIKYI